MSAATEDAKSDLAALTAEIWQRSRDDVIARVAAVEEGVAALLRGDADPDVRSRAASEAHKLAGSVGMFGFAEGTELARFLQEAFTTAGALDPSDVAELAAAVVLLRRELEGGRQAGDQNGCVDDDAGARDATAPTPRSATAPASGRAPAASEHAADGAVLAVDDDPLILEVLHEVLGWHGFALSTLSDPKALWETLEDQCPQLILLDVDMPGTSGIDLCHALRSDERYAQLPVIFLTAHQDAELVRSLFEAGADDYVSKPIVGPELRTRISNRLERVRLFRDMADRDPLTGVLNRRSSAEALERHRYLAERYSQPLSLALLDVDQFKQVNDRYGHPLGDAVLARLGELLTEQFRGEDVVARWGGEEFVLGMFGMERADGVRKLERLLEAFRAIVVTDDENEVSGITFTGGVAQYGVDGDDLQTVYRAADEALLRGKAAGRAQVVVALGS